MHEVPPLQKAKSEVIGIFVNLRAVFEKTYLFKFPVKILCHVRHLHLIYYNALQTLSVISQMYMAFYC